MTRLVKEEGKKESSMGIQMLATVRGLMWPKRRESLTEWKVAVLDAGSEFAKEKRDCGGFRRKAETRYAFDFALRCELCRVFLMAPKRRVVDSPDGCCEPSGRRTQ
jgi:hypothetical protein